MSYFYCQSIFPRRPKITTLEANNQPWKLTTGIDDIDPEHFTTRTWIRLLNAVKILNLLFVNRLVVFQRVHHKKSYNQKWNSVHQIIIIIVCLINDNRKVNQCFILQLNEPVLYCMVNEHIDFRVVSRLQDGIEIRLQVRTVHSIPLSERLLPRHTGSAPASVSRPSEPDMAQTPVTADLRPATDVVLFTTCLLVDDSEWLLLTEIIAFNYILQKDHNERTH